jgi:hypothetical protein
MADTTEDERVRAHLRKVLTELKARKDRQQARERSSSAGSRVSVGEVDREANTPSVITDVQDPA